MNSPADREPPNREPGAASTAERGAPPDSPTAVPKRGWVYIARKAFREFLRDQCIDQAAALTYFAVLAIFPALLALFSLLGVAGQGKQTVNAVVPLVEEVLGDSASQTLTPIIEAFATAPGSGITLVLAVLIALWSASGYVAAFGRAMNRVYGVGEGRPIWKLRPLMMLVTLIMVVLVSVVALMLVLSGGLVTSLGEALGLESAVITAWKFAKWPVIIAIVVLIMAILYYATPNVKQPKFRWTSVGALTALIVWILATAGFGVYISNFANYEKTYGTFAGVIIFLLWLWITNLALLFGAEVDAELERTRELVSGIPAEEEIQLPLRDEAKITKDARKAAEDVREGRQLRGAEGRKP